MRRAEGRRQDVTLPLRIDTPIEIDCLRHGGILPCVLRGLREPTRMRQVYKGTRPGDPT